MQFTVVFSNTNTGIFRPTADTIAFTEGGTEAMRIDSSGRVGIGTTNPTSNLTVQSAGGSGVFNIRTNASSIVNPNSTGVEIIASQLALGSNIILSERQVDGAYSDRTDLAFVTNTGFGSGQSEKIRIPAGGGIAVGKIGSQLATAGAYIDKFGNEMVVDGANVLFLNRNTNDGTIIQFRQANSVEGDVAVSGSTISYNGFTGTHWSRFIDESKPDVLRGTVMESLDQMTDWYNLEFTDSKNNKQKEPYALKANENEGDVVTYAWNTNRKDEEGNDIIEQVQATIVKEKDVKHVMSKISDTSEAKNVYGVFHAWDNDDLINNDFYVASVGSYVVRIKAGQTVSKGDLLQSNGDGTAKVQADDLVRASSFAKVLSNTVIETYEDGSFIVPCSLMC